MRIAYETSEIEDSISRINREREFLNQALMMVNSAATDAESVYWLSHQIQLLQDDLNRTKRELEFFSNAISRVENDYLEQMETITENIHRFSEML